MSRQKIIFTLVFLLSSFVSVACNHIPFKDPKEQIADKQRLLVFYSPGCNKCVEVKNKIMPDIEEEFLGTIHIEYRDTDDIENYKMLLSLKEKYDSKIELSLPVFYFKGQLLNGKGEIKNSLKAILAQSSAASYGEEALPGIDLMERFKGFKLIGIITAGLGDGVNPCAFTVIVFFMSYLALQGYRKRELAAIGLSFICAVFLTYFFIGLGLFNIIYTLEKFLLVRKIFNILIGVFSIALGALSVYDLFKFKNTKQTEGLLLQLPEAVKKQIHAVIGWHYRKPKERGRRKLKPHILKLIISALITGFLISFLELVCTGQLYLPTIKFVLKATPLKLQASGYLLLYNLMFIVPLLIVFLFALLGVTSEQFSRILKKHLLSIKILMAILFFALGALLLWRA